MKVFGSASIVCILVALLVSDCLAQSCDPKLEECPAEGAESETKRTTAKKSSVLRYPIQHALGSSAAADGFVDRGDIEVSVSKKTKKISIKFSQKSYEMSAGEAKAFEELVAEDGFYRIRVPTDISSATGPWLYASVKACLMAKHGFKESFRFHLDKSGKLTSIELQPLGENSACSQGDISLPKKITIRSKASAALPREAHVAKSEVLAQSSLQKSNIPAELQQHLGSGGLNTKSKCQDWIVSTLVMLTYCVTQRTMPRIRKGQKKRKRRSCRNIGISSFHSSSSPLLDKQPTLQVERSSRSLCSFINRY